MQRTRSSFLELQLWERFDRRSCLHRVMQIYRRTKLERDCSHLRWCEYGPWPLVTQASGHPVCTRKLYFPKVTRCRTSLQSGFRGKMPSEHRLLRKRGDTPDFRDWLRTRESHQQAKGMTPIKPSLVAVALQAFDAACHLSRESTLL